MPITVGGEIAEYAVETPISVPQPDETYKIADDRIEVVRPERVVVVDGREIDINTLRFDMLSHLASQADSTVPLPDIYKSVWGEDLSASSNAAGMQISLLRKSLGEELGHPSEGAIRTQYGRGYKAVSSLNDAPRLDTSAAYLIADGRIVVHPEEETVVADGRTLEEITAKEFSVLAELARTPDRVIGLGSLGFNLWGYTDQSVIDSIRVYIHNVRKRLGDELGNAREGAIRTRHGIGYYAVSSLDS